MKKYIKPELQKHDMSVQTTIATACKDPYDYWIPVDMDFAVIFVNEMIECDMDEKEFMTEFGEDDKSCYYAMTDDGVTFTGS